MSVHLTEADRSLLDRIEAFELDQQDSPLSFTTRLAREQNWTHFFAARVIQEYKRFVSLAMISGHPVTPSEEVDQVWHLHLVYTRSYWHDFCQKTLGRELHHGPTKGGQSEGTKFYDWYSRTLESYEGIFGEPPPPEIWPSPEKRFANAGCGRWVDRSKFWICPKPSFWSKFKS